MRKARKYQPNWRTPKKPQDLNLYDYVAFFTKGWTLKANEHVPCFSPSFKTVPHKSQTERFNLWAKTRMMIYTPGANPDNILEGFDNVEAAMKHFVEESGHCPPYIKEDWEEATQEKPGERQLDEEQPEVVEDDEFEYPELVPSVEGTQFIVEMLKLF